jgi:hypothetical protein
MWELKLLCKDFIKKLISIFCELAQEVLEWMELRDLYIQMYLE